MWSVRWKGEGTEQNRNLSSHFHEAVGEQISWMLCNKLPTGEPIRAAHTIKDKKINFWAQDWLGTVFLQEQTWLWLKASLHLGRNWGEGFLRGKDVAHLSSCTVCEFSNIPLHSLSATSVGHSLQVQWQCSRGAPIRLLRMAQRANQAFWLTSHRYSSTLMWLQYSTYTA